MAGEFLGTLGHSHADTGTSNVSRPGSVSRKPGFVAVISLRAQLRSWLSAERSEAVAHYPLNNLRCAIC